MGCLFGRTCSSQRHSALTQAQENVEVLQQRVWSLEEELGAHHGILQLLQEMLPECQGKEREQLEFRKSVVEEQMSRAQRAVSADIIFHDNGHLVITSLLLTLSVRKSERDVLRYLELFIWPTPQF